MLNPARRILRTAKSSSRQLAELAGAVANRELLDGSFKEARGLLRFALEQPTDNIVAQAMTDARILGLKLDEPAIQRAITQSSEAQLLQSWMVGDEAASESHALKWHAEEPFSSRPLQFLTALYSLQGEYTRALAWVERGVLADPFDPGLISNLSFAQAAAGNELAAEVTMKRARSLSNAELEPFFKATEGLIALRRGDFLLARNLYREAEEIFIKSGREPVAALCVAHYAKFATECGAPDAEALIQEAQGKIEKAPSTDGRIMMKRLATRPLLPVAEEQELRRLSQWVFDPSSNTLTQRPGITAKGAPAILIQPSKPKAPGK